MKPEQVISPYTFKFTITLVITTSIIKVSVNTYETTLYKENKSHLIYAKVQNINELRKFIIKRRQKIKTFIDLR